MGNKVVTKVLNLTNVRYRCNIETTGYMVIPHFVYNQSETTIPLIVYLMVAYVNVRLKQNKEIVLSGQSMDKSYKTFSSKAPMIFDTFFFFFHNSKWPY